jgi:hypothetical protein
MNEPLDELYFQWLCGQVGEVEIKSPAKSYWNILRKLFSTEFVWLIPNDDNRAQDGLDLRPEFVDHLRIRDVDQEWLEQGCSFLEFMIGLSRRLSFFLEGEPRLWFWRLAENLDIEQYNDGMVFPEERVDYILSNVVWRTFSPNGRGGLFPLKNRRCADQREVELWDQMNAYVLERD